jgi:hypothetical protein
MRASKTHFEQIPVATVKKIAKELPKSSVMPDEITLPQENWRELAKQVQQEQDPKRMTELVTQLLAEFDEENLRKGSGSVGSKPQ